MATYRITSPDGQQFDVTAPEGATQDQVLEYAKSNWKKGPAPAAQAKPQIEDPGLGQTLLIGAGRTFDRIGKGAQQMFYGATGQADKQAALKAQVAEDDRLYKPLQEMRPFATGIGESLPSMALPGGGATTLLGNAGRMALAGAVPGMLEYGTAEERLTRGATGAAAGAALPILGAGLKAGKSLVEPLYQSGREAIAGRTLNRVAGDSAADIISRLQNAKELVPGSRPTAAQVAESGGIAALERSAAASNPEAYTQRAMEQASARMNALRGIAGDDVKMAAAEGARKAATKDAYSAATGASYAIDAELESLLRRPIVKEAMARAEKMAANQGRPFSLTPNIPKDPLLAAGGIQRQALGANGVVTGQGMQDLKMAIDAMLADPAAGIAGKEGDIVRGVRSQIINWMEQRNPEFKAARTQYADLSKPIDQMKVGQYLMDKAAPALADFGALGQETGATFARAMRNADQTVRGATGFKGNANGLEGLMTPQQMQALTGVGQDLARKSNAQNLGRGVGSDTFQKFAMQNIAEQSGMPRLTRGLLDLPGVSRATNWMYRDTDQQVQGLLGEALLEPKKAAELMKQVGPKFLKDNPKLKQLLEQSVIRSGGLLGMGALASTE